MNFGIGMDRKNSKYYFKMCAEREWGTIGKGKGETRSEQLESKAQEGDNEGEWEKKAVVLQKN